MNCDSLSLSGERNVFASSIYLLLQTLSPSTGEYDTSLTNIYDIFLKVSDLLTTLDENSSHPVSSQAIASWVTTQLMNYRRTDVLLSMSEVEFLIPYFNNYRLLVNQTFTAIQTDTLSYDSGTDLKSRIEGIDSRLTNDESQLHSMASVLAGTDFMQSESSLQTWLATHVKDWVLDTALKQSKFHQIYESANLWSSNWMCPNDYIVSLTSHSKDYRPDDVFVGHSTRAIRNRFVYTRFTFHPSGLTGLGSAFGLGVIPSSDVLPCDMNIILYKLIYFAVEKGLLQDTPYLQLLEQQREWICLM